MKLCKEPTCRGGIFNTLIVQVWAGEESYCAAQTRAAAGPITERQQETMSMREHIMLYGDVQQSR